MLVLKYLLLAVAAVLFAGAAGVLLFDLYQAIARIRQGRQAGTQEDGRPDGAIPLRLRWRTAAKLFAAGWLPLLLGLSIVVVPSGMAGVRVSQFAGTLPGTLYPGLHFIKPLIEHVALYEIRDHVYTTTVAEDEEKRGETLRVQSKEGMNIGIAITVRFRLDAQRLDFIHANLPHPVEREIVAPVIASVFRQLVPNYMVREVFATRREEIRRQAAEEIARRLGEDAIVVKEVMLRDIQLPPEYAKGLEELLLKEQENERLVYEIQIKEKQVRTAELEAEAQKARQVKRAEADALTHVIQAKAEADAMQHTLPLKEKQIQQARLEAEARKEATLKNAEAAAQAKVIDSRAELERRKLLAEAEAARIRLTAAADAERLKMEADVLKQNPLLIQKIIAERLSDKVQIMMVPTDGRFFFANDVLRSPAAVLTDTRPPEDAPPRRP